MIMGVRQAAAKQGGEQTVWSRKLSLFMQSPPLMSQVISASSTASSLATQFDYMHVTSSHAYQNIFHPTNVLNEANMTSELASFHSTNFGNMKFILQLQTGGTAVDFSNNAHWTNIQNNLAKVGRVYRNSPLITGIMWDWEFYGGTYWFNDSTAVGLTGTLDDKVTTVRGRFKTMFEALLAEWPNVRFMTSYGAGFGGSYQWDILGAGSTWNIIHNDTAAANELMGAAFVGLAEAVYDAGNHAQLFDGGEYYGARTLDDFDRIRHFQQVLVPQNPAPSAGVHRPTLMTGMSGKYRVGSAVGIFDRSDYPGTSPEGLTGGQPLPAATLTNVISRAMRTMGGLVWFYNEWYYYFPSHSWKTIAAGWGGPVPSTILDAIAEGRRLGRL